MNEQERGLIEGLFQRLQQAETQSGPRDQEAEALVQNRWPASRAHRTWLPRWYWCKNMGVGGGMLLASAASGLFADEAEAAEPTATAAPEEPDATTNEDEGGFFDDFFGGGEDDEY